MFAAFVHELKARYSYTETESMLIAARCVCVCVRLGVWGGLRGALRPFCRCAFHAIAHLSSISLCCYVVYAEWQGKYALFSISKKSTYP